MISSQKKFFSKIQHVLVYFITLKNPLIIRLYLGGKITFCCSSISCNNFFNKIDNKIILIKQHHLIMSEVCVRSLVHHLLQEGFCLKIRLVFSVYEESYMIFNFPYFGYPVLQIFFKKVIKQNHEKKMKGGGGMGQDSLITCFNVGDSTWKQTRNWRLLTPSFTCIINHLLISSLFI